MWADIASGMLRGAHVCALASLFGTLVFAYALPRAARTRSLDRRLNHLAVGSVWLALALGFFWLLTRTAAIAEAQTMQQEVAALPAVALHTQFGQILIARCIILIVLSARLRQNRVDAIVLSAIALGLQAAMGHAAAMRGAGEYSLMGAEILHVLAAGAWLGALLPLLISLATIPANAAARVVRRFFPFGLTAVCIIAVTSVVQSVILVGSVPALLGTDYGHVALLKALLFLALLTFAATNRFVLIGRPGWGLRLSIAGEAGIGVAVVLAASFLAHLMPGAHEQPIWPFSVRISLEKAKPFLVPAYPTSFYLSPVAVSAGSIVRGERRYQIDCAACHGAEGRGAEGRGAEGKDVGPLSRALPVAPPDLTARRLMDTSDGDLFWFAGHAVPTEDTDRWDLIDYLRARNTGEFIRTSNRGAHPLRLPRFDVTCTDGRSLLSEDLHGQVLRLATAFENKPLAAPIDGLLTIGLAATGDSNPGCVAQPEMRQAIAILLGTTPDALAGVEMLVDGNGWLRARWKPGDPGGWPTPDRLSFRIQTLAAHPLAAGDVKPHHH